MKTTGSTDASNSTSGASYNNDITNLNDGNDEIDEGLNLFKSRKRRKKRPRTSMKQGDNIGGVTFGKSKNRRRRFGL